RSGRYPRSENPPRTERPRSENPPRSERNFRSAKPPLSEKPFGGDKTPRPEKPFRAKRGFRSESTSNSEKPFRSERAFKSERPYKKTLRRPPSTKGSSPPHRRHLKDAGDAPKSDKIRLNKYIANSGVSSRREADELIQMGLISVNGKVVSELGFKVSPSDEVRYESRVLRAEKPVYILMNKPKGFITTTDDP